MQRWLLGRDEPVAVAELRTRPPGDLLLRISAEKHPRFKRLKDDLYAEISISPELAEKGGSLAVAGRFCTVMRFFLKSTLSHFKESNSPSRRPQQ